MSKPHIWPRYAVCAACGRPFRVPYWNRPCATCAHCRATARAQAAPTPAPTPTRPTPSEAVSARLAAKNRVPAPIVIRAATPGTHHGQGTFRARTLDVEFRVGRTPRVRDTN